MTTKGFFEKEFISTAVLIHGSVQLSLEVKKIEIDFRIKAPKLHKVGNIPGLLFNRPGVRFAEKSRNSHSPVLNAWIINMQQLRI